MFRQYLSKSTFLKVLYFQKININEHYKNMWNVHYSNLFVIDFTINVLKHFISRDLIEWKTEIRV